MIMGEVVMRKILYVVVVSSLLSILGCRNVLINSDSLLATNRDDLIAGINSTESWVFKENVQGGSTSYTNKALSVLYSKGFFEAFGAPDATVMSFGTNESLHIYYGSVSYTSAFESFWRLAHQTVEAGSRCIVLFEGSHTIGELGNDLSDKTNVTLTKWFYDMHQLVGDREYLGNEYRFVIADMSHLIEDDRERYISDYVHLTLEGTIEAAKVIKAALATCPAGRWNFFDLEVGYYEYADGEGAAELPWYIR
jgi:hypothetical protein